MHSHLFYISQSFNNLFNDIFNAPIVNTFSEYLGRYEVEKIDDKNQLLICEVPGINKKDLKVTYDEEMRLLSIDTNSGTKRKFKRAWTLPHNTKVGEAEMQDGLLKIKIIDVTPPEKSPLQITIK